MSYLLRLIGWVAGQMIRQLTRVIGWRIHIPQHTRGGHLDVKDTVVDASKQLPQRLTFA
jgi:hypothetical protein